MAPQGSTSGAGPAGPTTLDEALQALRKKWDHLALRGFNADCFVLPGAGSAAGFSAGAPALNRGGGGNAWRGLGLETLAEVPSWLPIPERLPGRAANRAWWRASEHGPAQAAWMEALGIGPGTAAVAATAVSGGILAATYGRCRFLASKEPGHLFKGKPSKQGELTATNRVKAPEPVAAFADGTAAFLSDRATGATSVPDVALFVHDTVHLAPVGVIPLSGAKHGQTIQRPLSVVSLQAATSSSAFNMQACVAALERLVVVFSWQMATSGTGEIGAIQLQLLGGRVDEVRWGENNREVLKSAAFTAAGPLAPVAVLLERKKEGPAVEVYTREATGYSIREIIPIAAGPPPTPGAPMPRGALHGRLVVWAVAGCRTVDFARVPELAVDDAGGSGDASAGTGGSKGAAVAFARARQQAKKSKLRLGEDGSAGLDMEATNWGYLIEEVAEEPGQPSLKAGCMIIAIAGQALHGLEEEVMNWRFGRGFGDGAEITYLAADHAGMVLAAEKASTEAPMEAPKDTPKAAEGATKRLTQARWKVEFPARLEAWCVAHAREPPRLLAVVDNRIYISDLAEDRPVVKDVLAGLVRPPLKRPALQISLLDSAAGDVLLVGVAKGVQIWRVPALLKPILDVKSAAAPELLATVPISGRCSFGNASLGLALGAESFGWLGLELTGAGESGGNVDLWQWFSAIRKPAPPLPAAARGRVTNSTDATPGEGDTVARILTGAGAVVDKLGAALRRGVTLVPSVTQSFAAKDSAALLRAWVGKLPDTDGEILYAAANDAEKGLADGIRELRTWIRVEGGKAANISVAARADDARAVSQWSEECRRSIIWPLQAAFEAEPSDHEEGDEDEDAPATGGLRFPLLAAASQAAVAAKAAAKGAAKGAAKAAASPASAPVAATEASTDRPMSARERAAAAAAARAAAATEEAMG